MKKLNCGVLAVGLIAVSGWAAPPSVGPDLSGSVTIPAASAAPKADTLAMGASVITPPAAPMPSYSMATLPDHSYRELNDAVAVRKLLAPCVLFTADVGETAQVQALGAPIAPLPGETATSQHQARFPLLILAW